MGTRECGFHKYVSQITDHNPNEGTSFVPKLNPESTGTVQVH